MSNGSKFGLYVWKTELLSLRRTSQTVIALQAIAHSPEGRHRLIAHLMFTERRRN
jgi:hypothetical protein